MPYELTEEDRLAIRGRLGARADTTEGRRLLRIFFDRRHWFPPLKMYHPEADQVRIALDMVEVADRWFKGSGITPPWDVPGWRHQLEDEREV